jgi:hypothetical protein
MTERLYYNDPHLLAFDAAVTAIEADGLRALVVLDRTAFYPTSGGQPFDTGTLGVVAVTASTGAQAAQVLLMAIEKSDGSRSGVIDQIHKVKVGNGLIGSFEFNKNGDITGAKGAALLFTIYVGQGSHLQTNLTTAPEASLVEAARKAAAG